MTGPLMLDLEGTSLTRDEAQLLRRGCVGGVILFARNYQSPGQVRTLIRAIRAQRKGLLIAVDQEGGRVQRFREGLTRLPSMAALGRLYETEPEYALTLTRSTAWLMAVELRDLDVDFSFAPVLDLDHGLSEVIGDRSFHSDPEVVTVLAQAWTEGIHEAGMAAVGKHYPGHGAVTADSHHAVPEDSRSLSDISASDLVPFRKLSRQGLDGVMPAHVIYSQVDDQPAGFSPVWLQDLLRRELGFAGAIFSDDLTMAGAAVAGDVTQRAGAALDAGCDMILVCNDPAAALTVADWLDERKAKASSRLLGMRGKPQEGPRGAYRSTARYRDTRAAIMRLEENAHG
ncbi:MAG: beta-N-acetylhexosaminidase [Oleiphilaceae bacterium]|nr:beta-N-acetylhexosaminidase [Oleiphilaceae bacterium]